MLAVKLLFFLRGLLVDALAPSPMHLDRDSVSVNVPVNVFEGYKEGPRRIPTIKDGQYYCFRIPSLIFHGNELLAFAEGRTGKGDQRKRQGLCFDHGEIHIVWKKSSDLGVTWTPYEVVRQEPDQTFGNHIPFSFEKKLQ